MQNIIFVIAKILENPQKNSLFFLYMKDSSYICNRMCIYIY